jgi:hypothetical protein
LDTYGDWVDESEYGPVWYPRQVAVEWSPYSYGRWTWISPWGWTWVDDAPWGFAPFHYGRWASVRGRWGWVPGPLHVRPVYAPALVAWVGTAPPRSGISVSIAFGSGIGWFPLAPHEVYVPSYYCSRRHLNNVNFANTIAINTVYLNRAYNDRSTHFEHVNRTVRNGVTVVRPETFTGARSVRDHMIRVDQHDLHNWETHNAIPDVRPQRDRAAGSWHGAPMGADRNHERDVVMRHTPPQPSSQGAAHNRGEPMVRERSEHPSPTNGDGSRNAWRGHSESPTPRFEPNRPPVESRPPTASPRPEHQR